MNIASNQITEVSGTLRVSAPPTIFDSALAPVIYRFQQLHPDVRVHVFITERILNQIEEGIDLAFRVDPLEDSSLVVRHLLAYRHRLVSSPTYFKGREMPKHPRDLLDHRLVSFSFLTRHNTWTFSRSAGGPKESIDFQPHISINDYSKIAFLLVAGAGIGEIPPMVEHELLRDGRLVEVMPRWRFEPVYVSIVHLGNRYIARPVRLFKELASEMVPKLLPHCTPERNFQSQLLQAVGS